MADHTDIELSDATWNIITGCTLVSEGCRHCYAARLAATRLKHHPSRKGLARLNAAGEAKFTGEVRFNRQWLDQPLRWKRPRKIFVCAHGDLFHESVPDEWIDQVFAVMALAPQHSFQVLTKRPERMREYLTRPDISVRVGLEALELTMAALAASPKATVGKGVIIKATDINPGALQVWPLPNVWLGTSVEDQATADARIPHLLATPAAVRFVSAEPLLGPLDLRQWLHDYGCGCGWGGDNPLDYCRECGWRGVAPDKHVPGDCPGCGMPIDDYLACPECDGHDGDGLSFGPNSRPRLDWVIVGGESGPDARPMHPDWARSLRDQCAAAGVAFLFKQWGMWREPVEGEEYDTSKGRLVTPPAFLVSQAGTVHCFEESAGADPAVMLGVGKSAAGRLLDGIEHNGFPS